MNLRRFVPSDEILLRIVLIFLILVMLFAYYAGNIIQNVPPGHAGVLWSRFFGGTVTDRHYPEGIRLIFPWDRMYMYDVRTQHRTDTFEAVTLDGLSIKLTLDLRYHVIPEMVGLLHKHVGEDYRETLIDPVIGAFSRTQVSRFNAEEVYSTQRLYIENEILQQVTRRRGIDIPGRTGKTVFIHYENVLLHGVDLPEGFRQAIESKVTQQQVQQEWQFRVERERLEAERRIVEAQATRDILAMFPDRLADDYLRLKAIEALHSLAASPNAKIVVTGPNVPSVPIVVGADGQVSAGAAGSGAAAGTGGASAIAPALPAGSRPTVSPPVPRTVPTPQPAPTTTAPAVHPVAPAAGGAAPPASAPSGSSP